MRRLFDVDLLAGLGAVGYAITSLFVLELQQLVDPKISGPFGLAALSRWYARRRKERKAGAKATTDAVPGREGPGG